MIKVIKRNGSKEELDYEKINKVLQWATEDVKNVSFSDVAMNANLQIFDNIKTTEIHKVLIQSASNLISEETPNYQYVASNLLNYYIRKEVFHIVENMPSLYSVIENNIKNEVYDLKILEWYTKDEIAKIDKFVKHERDFNFTYAGLQQLVDKYLLKNRKTEELYETPQYMYVLIAMTLFKDYDNNSRINKIRSFYDDISLFKISLPTPIMSGVRTPLRQYSSCVLVKVDDTLDSIFNTNTAIGKYTAQRAGIGIDFGRIRSINDQIRNGEVVHTGVIPFLKVFEATVKSCVQNGIRGGGATASVPFWHKEIMDILVLKNNKGSNDNRVRKLDYNIQFNRLFYKRVKENKNIALFSPNVKSGSLYEAFFEDNEAFEILYEQFENDNKIDKIIISARDLMNHFCQQRIDTGRIYLMNVDHVNKHSSFKEKIYQSNLCEEITLPTKPLQNILDGDDTDAEIALCVLSAINLGIIKEFKDLETICENIVRSLDSVITHQDYPINAAKKMLKRRSIGVGVTNLAYYLAKNNLKYSDKNALYLIDELFEHIQYYLLKASNTLAKEFGKCEWFDKTKYADGILPIDTYNKKVDTLVERKYTLDWESLRHDIKEFGLRNSTLTAIMPCESSSLVTNSTNGIEPIRDTFIAKKSKKGVIRQLVPESNKLKNKYSYAFEFSNKDMTNIVAVIQKWIDQSISTNHYYNTLNYPDKKLPLSEVANDVMYAYQMGIKTLYYANSYDNKTDDFTAEINSVLEQTKIIEEVQDDLSCESGACAI